jgi:hypothetical protein
MFDPSSFHLIDFPPYKKVIREVIPRSPENAVFWKLQQLPHKIRWSEFKETPSMTSHCLSTTTLLRILRMNILYLLLTSQ